MELYQHSTEMELCTRCSGISTERLSDILSARRKLVKVDRGDASKPQDIASGQAVELVSELRKTVGGLNAPAEERQPTLLNETAAGLDVPNDEIMEQLRALFLAPYANSGITQENSDPDKSRVEKMRVAHPSRVVVGDLITPAD
jgi:hypothetical protein